MPNRRLAHVVDSARCRSLDELEMLAIVPITAFCLAGSILANAVHIWLGNQLALVFITAMHCRSGESIDITILRPCRSESLEHKYLQYIQPAKSRVRKH